MGAQIIDSATRSSLVTLRHVRGHTYDPDGRDIQCPLYANFCPRSRKTLGILASGGVRHNANDLRPGARKTNRLAA